MSASDRGFYVAHARPFPDDMWVVASRGRLRDATGGEGAMAGDRQLPAAFQALLAVSKELSGARKTLAAIEADRASRLEQVHELTRRVQEAERRLGASDADRVARLYQVHDLTRQVRELEIARAEDATRLTALLRESEGDRAGLAAANRSMQTELGRMQQTLSWRVRRAIRALGARRARAK